MRPLAIVLWPGVRARAFLQMMLRAGFSPDTALLLGDDDADTAGDAWGRPPQPDFDPRESLRATLERAGITPQRIDTLDVNAPALCAALAAARPRFVIFSGGGILRREALQAAPRWIHVHPGWLPDHRGSTCLHYGLLLKRRVGVTALLMEAGIDTGPILLRREFPIHPQWTAASLDHSADAWMRAVVLIDCLQALDAHPRRRAQIQDAHSGQTFYVIHPVLKHLALLTLGPHNVEATARPNALEPAR